MHHQNSVTYCMSVFSNVNILWQSFTGQTKSNPVNVVAQRFLQVFHDHGLQATQIPRLLPQIKLDDLKSEEALLVALTPDVLDQAAHLFGIRTAWLEGVDDCIYDCLSCYKQPEIFFENLAMINCGEHDSDVFYVQTLVATKQLDMNDPSQQLLVVVVAEKIAELNNQCVYRYHVYGDGWDWGYWPTRIQLKAIARLLFKKFGKTMPIYTTQLTDLENIREGRLIPRNYLGRCLLSEPSLEDYAMTQEENFHEKEITELPEVLKYIEEHNLESHIDLQLARTSPPIEPAPVKENVSKPTASAVILDCFVISGRTIFLVRVSQAVVNLNSYEPTLRGNEKAFIHPSGSCNTFNYIKNFYNVYAINNTFLFNC